MISSGPSLISSAIFGSVRLCIGVVARLLRSRQALRVENLVLRQHLAVFKRQHSRPSLKLADKFFWVLVRRLWSQWKNALIIVSPETVVRCHRAGFRQYWFAVLPTRPSARRQS